MQYSPLIKVNRLLYNNMLVFRRGCTMSLLYWWFVVHWPNSLAPIRCLLKAHFSSVSSFGLLPQKINESIQYILVFSLKLKFKNIIFSHFNISQISDCIIIWSRFYTVVSVLTLTTKPYIKSSQNSSALFTKLFPVAIQTIPSWAWITSAI